MATGQGIAEIDFGAGSNEAQVVVTGQTAIGTGSNVEAYVMADDTTTDHTAEDHRWFSALVGLTCGALVAGTGFTIYGKCTEKLDGKFKVRFVWAD